jgi:hypothetical protein
MEGFKMKSDAVGTAKVCERLDCCEFFNDNMQNLPKSAQHIKNKLCFGDYEKCNRYKIFKEFGVDNVLPNLIP